MFYEQMEASRQQSYSLGYLFDKKSGRHICQSPWDHADIAEHAVTLQQPSTSAVLESTNSLSSRSKHFFVDAELAMTITIVKIGGGLEFGKDSGTKSDRKGFFYSREETTKTTMLTMAHFEEIRKKLESSDKTVSGPIKEILQSEDATHIVSGITYGSKALLKFTDTESENSSGLEIGGKIEAGINLLVASVSASIELEIGEKEKKVMKSLECEFLGDYSGIPVPTSLEDAGDLVAELRHQTAKVPVVVFLTPLSSLLSLGKQLKPKVDLGYAKTAYETILDMDKVLRGIDGLKNGALAKLSREFSNTLDKISHQFHRKAEEMKTRIQGILANPQNKSHQITDTELEEELTGFKNSVFSKNYIKPLLKKLKDENSFLQRLLETAKQSGLGIAIDDGDSRKMEMDANEDQVGLQLDLVSSLPTGLVELLAADSLKEKVSPPVSPDTWMAEKNRNFQSEIVEKFLKLISIKETNTDRNCSLRINYNVLKNKASMILKENGKPDQEYLEVFNIENVQISKFTVVGDVFSTNIKTNSQKVEVLVNSINTGKEETKTFDTSSGKMAIPLEELGLEMGLSYKLKVRAKSPQGLKGAWQPEKSIVLELLAKAQGITASSVKDDDWQTHGPQLALQPGPGTFSTGPGDGAWLELILERPTYVSGVVLICPRPLAGIEVLFVRPSSEDSPPAGAVVLSNILMRKTVSGKTQRLLLPASTRCQALRIQATGQEDQQQGLDISNVYLF